MASKRNLAWGALAVVIGLGLSALPPLTAMLILCVGVLSVAALADVRIALVITLFIAPLKVLLETEVPALAAAPVDIGQILLLFTGGIWLAHSALQHKRLVSWTPLYFPLLIFILLVLPSFWDTLSLESALKELAKWIEILLIIALVFSVTEADTHWLVAAVIASSCTQAALGIYQFFGGAGPASFWILDYQHFRAFGSFGNPDPFGGFMSLGLCVALGAFIYCLENLRSPLFPNRVQPAVVACLLLALLALMMLGLGLLFSWSRGAWLGFAAALVVMLVGFPRRRWVGLTLMIILIGVVALGFTFQLIPASIVSRLNDFTQQYTGFDVRGVAITDGNYALIERLAHWQAAITMAADHPWFGVGLGSYATAYPRYALMNWPLALGHAHNYYLNILAETGLVGLTGYLFAVVGIFWLIIKSYLRNTAARALIVGILGAWVGLSIHNAFDMLYVNNLSVYIGVLLGLIARYLYKAKGLSTYYCVH